MDSLELQKLRITIEERHNVMDLIVARILDSIEVNRMKNSAIGRKQITGNEDLGQRMIHDPERIDWVERLAAVNRQPLPPNAYLHNPTVLVKFYFLKVLFNRYLRLLDKEIQSARISQSEPGADELVFRAVRRSGGHVLKDAKKIFRLYNAVLGPVEVAYAIGWQQCDIHDRYFTNLINRRTVVEVTSRYWPHFAECTRIKDTLSNQERSDLHWSTICVLPSTAPRAPGDENGEIGRSITRILSKA